MKIAYIIDWNINADSGVLKKVAAKISIWESMGHEVHFCIVSSNTQNQFLPDNSHHVTVFETPEMKWLPGAGFKKYFGRTKAFHDLSVYLRKLSVDVIYFRQTRWYFPMDALFSSIPTIMEVNSDDLSEKKLTGSKINLLISAWGNKRLIRKIKGIVAVTHELANLYQKESLKIVTISNGVIVKENVAEYQKQNRPQLIFVGTPGQAWHGVEKVYEMAEKLPGFDFNIVGPSKPKDINYENIIFHGYLNATKLGELYKLIDVGIGTLSLYLNNMSEACPLKVREYLSYGIPVIVGYKDVDVDGRDFVLHIGNYEGNVTDNIENIRSFVELFYGNRIDKNIINPLIDLNEKEKKRLTFIREFEQKQYFTKGL